MSEGESSSSEDLPLAALGKKRGREKSDEDKFGFDDDDSDGDVEQEEIEGEEPDSDDFIAEDSDDDEDEDEDYTSVSSGDVPLTSLKSRKKAPPPKKANAKPINKKAAAKRKTTPKKKKASKKDKSAASKKLMASSTGNYLCPSGELYSNCDKGKLIQSLLARWWYVYKWPDPNSYEESTPSGYDALDGFPGVYICTHGSEAGKILDRRDHAKSPSFNNFAKKDSEELRELLVRAIEEQTKELVRHEGEGTATQKSLKVMQKWAAKLNCAKADREAVKVLKAKRLTLS